MSDVGDICDGFQPKKKDSGGKLDPNVAKKTCGGNGIDKTLLEFVYADEDEDAMQFIDDVEAFRKKKVGQRGDREEIEIEERIRVELGRVLDWCEGKFGVEVWMDASSAWVENSEEISKISGDMVSGGKGHRDF